MAFITVPRTGKKGGIMIRKDKMKVVIKAEPKPGIQIGEMPLPQISPEEVLIRVKAVGICGSDVHIYEWVPGYDFLTPHMPLVLGHEFSGEVAEVGSQVTGHKVGDRVVFGYRTCGQCFYCVTARPWLCDGLRALGRIGIERKGGMAEYVVINSRQSILRIIPPEVSFEEASMGMPTAEALHMLEEGEVSLGDPVVVLGTGPIAVTVAQGAKAAGASPVVVTGLSLDQYRLSVAKSLGADETIDVQKDDPVAKVKAMTGGLGAAKVFEVSGSPSAFNQGLEMLRKGGTMVTFGIFPEEVSVDITRRVIREMKVIRGVYGDSPTAWEKVLPFMAAGKIRVAPLITHRLPLEQADEGFRACLERKAMKVILLPNLRKPHAKIA
jgi:2-desacetyl-2-hydroxyethyl bacteriochlorophyllide A dehydrogenase